MSVNLDRSRSLSSHFLEWVRGKGKVLIVAHDNPDPDSLAAAFALQLLLEVKAGKKATISFGGIIGRGENQAMVRELEIRTTPLDKLDLDQFGIVCMVDCQPGSGNVSFPAERQVHLVIDHHPIRPATQQCRWVDVREDYGASATILYEYLICHEVYVGTKLATMLFYAIKSETQDLGREWTQSDRAAYLNLLHLSNNRILFNITHAKVPREYFAFFNRAIENSRLYDQVLVFNLFDIDIPEIVAEMADFLLRMEGIEVVLGLGRYRESGILSMRTSSHQIVAGEVMQQVLEDLGTGGGHGMTAGGQIEPLRGNTAILKELQSTLTRRLLGVLGRPVGRGCRLVPR